MPASTVPLLPQGSTVGIRYISHDDRKLWEEFTAAWQSTTSFGFCFLVEENPTLDKDCSTILGVAISWSAECVYFIQLSHQGELNSSRWNQVWSTFQDIPRGKMKVSSSIQDQFVSLIKGCSGQERRAISMKEPFVDVLVAEWLLKPGEETLKK